MDSTGQVEPDEAELQRFAFFSRKILNFLEKYFYKKVSKKKNLTVLKF